MESDALLNKIKFSKLLFEFLRSTAFLAVLLLITSEFLLTDLLNLLIFDDLSSDSSRIFKALLQVLITIPFSIFIYVFIYWSLGSEYKLNRSDKDFKTFILSNIKEWILVQIRTYARVILFSFLLIIPGLIENARLAFASLHVFFNENMKDPYYDPIIDSREKLRPFTLTILFFISLSFILPLSLSFAFSERSVFTQPGLRIFQGFVMTFVICLTQSFIFYNYLKFHTNNDLTLKE